MTSGRGIRAGADAGPSLGGRLRAFGRIVAADLVARHRGHGEPGAHLDAAIDWLKRAHDLGRDGGVSYGYCLRGGWRAPYRETSGYISNTFFDLAERRGDEDCRARAIAICRWLCDVQNRDGSIANPRFGSDGIVFDTGQVLGGLVRAFRETRDARFLVAARRAADWLVAVADGEGRWTRSTFLGVPHVYNTRTAWLLLTVETIAPHRAYSRVARANLDWAVGQQNRLGWFAHCGFRRGDAPFTHTIAYAIEGLLEAGLLLDEARYVEAARRTAEGLLPYVHPGGLLPGRIDTAGAPRARYTCLTGNCQLATVWARLYDHSGDERFRAAARIALRYVMEHQAIDTADRDVRGGIKGSQPVWGAYAPFAYPSWAGKFFIDAMLCCMRWRR